MNQELKVAVAAALEAGVAIMKIYESGDFDVTIKGDDSPLTRADLASHKVIIEHLEKTGIPVLSEEGRSIPLEERQSWKTLWIVDPIDGTKEFIKRNGEFTVNIALVQDGRPILGVIFVPVLGDLYFGTVDQGAKKTSAGSVDWSPSKWMDNGESMPLEQVGRPYTVVASRSHMSAETEDYVEALRDEFGEVDLISKGSSLKLCMVAEGKADCYPRFAPTMEWDTAAGQAICSSSSCEVLNWETSEELAYNRVDLLNPWFLVRRL
tara:strand:+ start:878 stop:1672 length:795 start_codon:yes stop_codon:yes gene_type:complete